MMFVQIILWAFLGIVPGGDAFLRQLQPRDSVLIADQLRYGVKLEDVKEGDVLAFPDLKPLEEYGLVVVSDWKLDTLVSKRSRRQAAKTGPVNLEASVVLAPFEEGEFEFPPLPVLRQRDTLTDTLVFNSVSLDVKSMPVDTATFVPHDLKGQIRYPLTFREILPWWFGALALIALVCGIIMIVRRKINAAAGAVNTDPAYIVALRKLEKFRSDKHWAPEKQKSFYSGVTDALKEYIDASFGIDAPEMTTAELFDAIKKTEGITPELYSSLKELFERADFVKFAKYTASDEENAATVPLSVRFVMETYKADEPEDAEPGKEAEK